MYPVSLEFLKAVQENTRVCYFEGKIKTLQGREYLFGNQEIVKGSGYVLNQCCSETEIGIGTVYAAEMGITLYSEIDHYTLEGAFIELSYHLEVAEGRYESVPMGVFEISEANRMVKCLEIKAYDYMLRFDKPFKTNASSGNAYDFLKMAGESCGVELAQSEQEIQRMENGSTVLGIYSENTIESWRDLLAYTAQVLGCFATINREGKLELRSYNRKSVWKFSDRHRFSSSFSDFVTRYTAISSTNQKTATAEYYALEKDDGLTMNLGINPLLQFGLEETRKKLLTNTLHKVAEINYVPFDSVTIGNPALDLGDCIQFSNGQADENQKTCITSYHYKLNGKQTVKCVGKNPRLSQAKSKNDKNIIGLLNQIEAGKIAVRVYRNAAPVVLGADMAEIINMEFAANEDTDAQFFASILLDVSAETVERQVTASITVPDSEKQQGDRIELVWTEEGKASFQVIYKIDDKEEMVYRPTETWQSGQHILNLYYPLTGIAKNTMNRMQVYLTVSGGEAIAERGWILASVRGQGVSANQNWDGRIEIKEQFAVVEAPGHMVVKPISEMVSVKQQIPTSANLTQQIHTVVMGGIRLIDMEEEMSILEKDRTEQR
ncbi:hypothetical protein [Robinsoniella peoriensis]|uniref:hypothetical protein n=1 Tax=Robinsoniella peoriensis TaxID=180332 RepID=UPI00069382B6|nr:hypothetical protein [Robinsoniella peoriensis]